MISLIDFTLYDRSLGFTLFIIVKLVLSRSQFYAGSVTLVAQVGGVIRVGLKLQKSRVTQVTNDD